jgi:hypothetical protein
MLRVFVPTSQSQIWAGTADRSSRFFELADVQMEAVFCRLEPLAAAILFGGRLRRGVDVLYRQIGQLKVGYGAVGQDTYLAGDVEES